METRKATVFALISFSLIALCIMGLEPALAAEDSWVQKASMHVPRAYLGVATVDGKIFAIGGDEGALTGNCMTAVGMTSSVVNGTEEYDPSLDQWATKASMLTARARFGTAVYQGKIFCIGGYNSSTKFVGPEDWNWKTEYYDLSANEVYDPATDTWETKTPISTPRYAAATNIVKGKIYVIGGHTMTDLYKTLSVNEIYDPATDTWETKTPAPLKVETSASAVVDNKIYVLGLSPDSYSQYVIQVYDPTNDNWTVKKNSPAVFSATAAATTGEKAPKRIYFFDENRTDIYDPASDSWTVGTPSAPRPVAGTVAVNDMLYIIGGRTGQWGYMTFMYPSALNEQYTPLGYGTPDSENQTPKPTLLPSQSISPTTSPTPSQMPSSTIISTASPTPSQTPSLTPAPSVPEFPQWILLTIGTASLIVVIIKKRKG